MPENTIRSPTDAERGQVQEIIHRHEAERPEGVRRVELAFGEDWNGHPAVYVNLFVNKGLRPTKDKIRELNDYVKILQNDIINEEIGFWPYSRTFEE
jgi:hypothetical protein